MPFLLCHSLGAYAPFHEAAPDNDCCFLCLTTTPRYMASAAFVSMDSSNIL